MEQTDYSVTRVLPATELIRSGCDKAQSQLTRQPSKPIHRCFFAPLLTQALGFPTSGAVQYEVFSLRDYSK